MFAERKQWLSSILQSPEDADGCPRSTTLHPRTIYRVPLTIRRVDDDAYTPLVVSIGPYHHQTDKAHRLYAMQIHKRRYLKDLLARSPDRNDHDCLNQLVGSIEKSSAEASYCERSVLMEKKIFTEMMLLDGCFIVELLLKVKEKKACSDIDDPIYSSPCMMGCVIHDLLLLENQIPFCVLESIFRHVQNTSSTAYLIQLALELFSVKTNTILERESKPVYHLLHLFHSHHLPRPHYSPTPSVYSPLRINRTHSFQYSRAWRNSPVKSIPSATQLKEAGVRFRVINESFLSITFEKGVMKIPYLFIEDITNAVLRNLIALEQCLPACGSQFTMYALFWDFLVNNARDVEILHTAGIIENGLGSNEDVTLMFNRMCKGIEIGSEVTSLQELMMRVNDYSETKTHVWRAKLTRDYFGSPWSFLSPLAAIFIIVFTSIQTIYTVLSYYSSKSSSSSN